MTQGSVWDHTLAAFILSGGTRYTEAELLTHYRVDSLEDVRAKQEEDFADLPEMNMLYRAIDLPVSAIVSRMQSHGVLVNHQRLGNIREELDEKRLGYMRRITDRLGEVNTNSPKQLGDALTQQLKITLPKTKTGQYSTSGADLAMFAPTHPVVQDILEYRAVDKVISTYIDAILAKVDQEGRIHPRYDLMSAATGRLASTDPNIQSTPVGEPYGNLIRSCFVAPQGGVLIGFDYSQQELRILAHLSKDANLMSALRDGHDIHGLTASRVLHLPDGAITPEARAIGKTLNFGIIYGETPYGLAKQLNKPVEECAHILKAYYETYSGIKRYFDNLLTSAKINGYIETICGRRRGIPGLPYGQPAKTLSPAQERVLKNYPIQGSAADMTKRAMVAIADHVLPRYPDADLVMQIHDELVFEYHSTERTKIDAFAKQVHDAMGSALPLAVPVSVDWKVGESWAQI